MSDIQKIKKYLEKISFKLIEDSYDENTEKMEVICEKNHTTQIIFSQGWMKKEDKCFECLREFFKENECTLISSERKNEKEYFTYTCKEGHNNSAPLTRFKNGIYKCKTCNIKNRRLSYDTVKEIFNKKKFTLLSKEYTSQKELLKFKCDLGHECEASLASIRNNGCSQCSGNKKYTLDEVKKLFEEREFCLISQEYVNSQSKLEAKCKEKHDVSITLANFLKGYGCAICSGMAKPKINDVKIAFEKEGYELLSTEYVNSHSALDFVCDEGHIHKISYTHFLSGQRCGICNSSKGEKLIEKVLKNDKDVLSFIKEKKFDDCKNILVLPFDFYVVLKNNKTFLIEFDGEQHFKPNKHFGGEKTFERQQKHDIIKTEYCKTKKISLLRISYKCYDKITQILSDFIKKVKNDNESSILFSCPTLYDYIKNI